jgi:hypothetical protein
MQSGQHSKLNQVDPTWYLIAEFLLNEITLNEDRTVELTTGSPFQTVQDLGISQEYIKRIERTITEMAKGARDSFDPTMADLPVHIRVYCNKKTVDEVHHSGDQMNGGWGYYVIERGRNLPDVPSQESYRVLELYIYKEGM